jgi:NADH-ubiquinone oxidoreductase chain 5
MYLTIIFLPILSALISGFSPRSIGTKGVKFLSCFLIFLTVILVIISFFEVGLNESSLSILLFNWLDSESLQLSWSFQFDSLTVSILIPVIIVSFCVHLYSTGYMENDAHVPRFFSYLSLFTFFMILLVVANNFLILFIGWEGVGVCSYLLINFWFRRLQANKAAIQAILVNRIGDLGFSLGLFFMFLTFGNLDFSIIFSMAPIINNNAILIICLLLFIGAMAKSAQMPLHIWLPNAIYLSLSKRGLVYTNPNSGYTLKPHILNLK